MSTNGEKSSSNIVSGFDSVPSKTFSSVTREGSQSPSASYASAECSFISGSTQDIKIRSTPRVARVWILNSVSRCIAEGPVTISLKFGHYEIAVHKSLLIHFSGYYRTALTRGFAEAESQKVDSTMPRFQKTTLEQFLSWIYTGKVTIDNAKISDITTGIDLYIFASHYSIPALRVSMRDFVAAAYPASLGKALDRSLPCQKTVQDIFDNLQSSDELRLLIVKVFATHWKPHVSSEHNNGLTLDDFPATFIKDLATQQAIVLSNLQPTTRQGALDFDSLVFKSSFQTFQPTLNVTTSTSGFPLRPARPDGQF